MHGSILRKSGPPAPSPGESARISLYLSGKSGTAKQSCICAAPNPAKMNRHPRLERRGFSLIVIASDQRERGNPDSRRRTGASWIATPLTGLAMTVYHGAGPSTSGARRVMSWPLLRSRGAHAGGRQARENSPQYRQGRKGAGGDAHDGPVSGHQGGASGRAPVLPHGGFLRTVLRGCGHCRGGARYRAHQARQAPGRGDPHVRRARARLRPLSLPPHPPGPQGGGVRTGGGPGGGQETRLQVRGQARGGAPRHPRHTDRGEPARRPLGQFPGRRGAGRRGVGHRLGGHVDR